MGLNPHTAKGATSMKEFSNTLSLCLGLLVLVMAVTILDAKQAVRDTRFAVNVTLRDVGIGFDGNSSFKIAMFADLHYGENSWEDWGPAQDVKSTGVMSKLLDQELPDFVVFLGDVITANNIAIHDATKLWQQALAPTAERSIPWASVFGNHDDAAFEWESSWFGPSGMPLLASGGYFQGTTRMELMESDMNSASSLSSAGPNTLWPSVSNYVIPIAASKGKAPAAIMYFLDSGGGSMLEVISAGQASWFKATSSEINPDASIPEIVFWHVPSLAYSQAGPKAYQPIQAPCVGSINDEGVAPQEAEWGIMNILARRTSVKAIFVGHNHGLDWCCPYHSLYLCFARHSGYGGYGRWTRGTRLLEIIEEPKFQIKTWVLLENGTVASKLIIA